MKFVELKCPNCGAHLEVLEGETKTKCKFCNTSFSIEDAYTDGYKYTKGVLKAQQEQLEENMSKARDMLKKSPFSKISIGVFVFIALIFVVVFSLIGYGIYQSFSGNSSFDVSSFNSSYESHAGKCSTFFLTSVLDDVVTNNKTNKKHQIVVEYNGLSSCEEKVIKEIRNSLKSGENYDIAYDYDKKGFICKMIINDMTNESSNDNDLDKMQEEINKQINDIKDKLQ